MPELDGIGLYRAVECQYPELRERFIFLTGDTLSPGTQTFFEQHPLPCLTKPLTAKKIRRAIQQALQA
jgi:two-component system NtrC family sensor kinase